MNSAAEYRWEELPGEFCPICSDKVRLFTNVKGGQDGDLVQCESCNHRGAIYRDEKSYCINWEPYESE